MDLRRSLAPRTHAGTVVPVLAAVWAAWILGEGYGGLLLTDYRGLDWDAVWWNLWLTAALGAVVTTWLVLVQFRVVTSATGAGLALAGFAVVARNYSEMLFGMRHIPAGAPFPGPVPFESALWVRGLGVVGFVFGVACTVAACVAERRLRAEGNGWAAGLS